MNRPSLILLAASLITCSPALAHELARDGNVGALLHIEPDDAPVTGRPNAAWFELNRRGGQPVLLSQCTCTLSVYAGSLRPGAKPSSTPALTQGQGRLGSSVTFPVSGAYTLVLQGAPRAGSSLPPFKLTWVVRADIDGTGTPGGHSH